MSVDGRPRFLRGAGWLSPESVPRAVELRINTFFSRRPGRSQLDVARTVGQQGFVVPEYPTPTGRRSTVSANRIGYVLEDEPDGRRILPADLPVTARPPRGVLIFLTLTPAVLERHPVPPGIERTDYAAYTRKADVILTDPYPMAHGCVNPHVASLSTVYDAVVELGKLVRGQRKAIGAWIETGPIEGYCGRSPVSPPTARAEAWAAAAAGAKVIVWFTHSWIKGHEDEFDVSPDMGNAMRTTNSQLARFAGVLLAPRTDAIGSAAADPIKVGVFRVGGKAYLVAVNLSDRRVTLSQDEPAAEWLSQLPGLLDQPIVELTTGRALRARKATFDDTFEPLDTRIYSWRPRRSGHARPE